MTEAELLGHVLELTRWLQLLAYHVPDSRRSAPGFPDLVIVGPNGLLFRELKSTFGRPTAEQTSWGWTIRAGGADWGIWRPLDWDTGQVEAELRAIAK